MKKIMLIALVSVIFIILAVICGYFLFKDNKVVDAPVCNEKLNNNEISPKKDKMVKVPFAKVVIDGGEEITLDKIDYAEINEGFLKNNDNIITNANELIGKNVVFNAVIPEGGLFYKNQLISKEELSNAPIYDLKDGYMVFSLAVDYNMTFGNSIFSGDKINLYIKFKIEKGEIIHGKIMQNVEVISIRDNTGKDINSQDRSREPKEMLIAVEDSVYDILRRASYIPNLEIIPVPITGVFDASDPEVSSEYLKNYILEKTENFD